MPLLPRFVTTVFLLTAGMVSLPTVVWFLISPVENRARAIQEAFRFRLIDLGCLLVYFQVLLGAVAAIYQAKVGGGGLWAVIGLMLAAISLVAWVASVNVLARAGIRSSVRRAAFILISVPGAAVASVAFVVSGALACLEITAYFDSENGGWKHWIPLGTFAAAGCTILVLRRISLWIVADACARTSGTNLASHGTSEYH